ALPLWIPFPSLSLVRVFKVFHVGFPEVFHVDSPFDPFLFVGFRTDVLHLDGNQVRMAKNGARLARRGSPILWPLLRSRSLLRGSVAGGDLAQAPTQQPHPVAD